MPQHPHLYNGAITLTPMKLFVRVTWVDLCEALRQFLAQSVLSKCYHYLLFCHCYHHCHILNVAATNIPFQGGLRAQRCDRRAWHAGYGGERDFEADLGLQRKVVTDVCEKEAVSTSCVSLWAFSVLHMKLYSMWVRFSPSSSFLEYSHPAMLRLSYLLRSI